MKKILHLLFPLMLLLASTTDAQPPQYYCGGSTTGGNYFPFGATGGGLGSKVQLLYQPGDFTVNPLPAAGTITKIYFRSYGASNIYDGTTNYNNIEIRMTQISANGLTTGASTFLTPTTQVFTATTHSLTFTQGQWMTPFVLQTPFPYTNSQNILVEVTVGNASATRYVAYNNAASSTRRMWGYAGQSTTVNGDAGLYDIGFDIQTGPPCPAPTGVNATNVLSTSATLSWNAVSGSVGYDYFINQNAAVTYPLPPLTTTTATTFNATGLTPATQYYLHLRNKCSATNPSPWVDYSFTTLPPCEPPTGFNVTNLMPNSGTINWSPWPSAVTYDYIVDQNPNTPTSTTGATNTASTSANLTGLNEYEVYYVHIRSNCLGNQQSWWSLDSFRTPIPCRAPVITIDNINTDQAVAWWPAVASAYEYEYAMSTSATPPVIGTKYDKTSILMHALQDGKSYYIHVRSQCNSLGILSTSPWGTATFKTFPVGVNTVTGEKLNMEAYPNPVKDVMAIRFNGKRNGTGTLVVTDISGRQIRSMQVNSDKVEIDLSGYPSGMYLVKYTDQVYSTVIKVDKE